MTSTEAFCPYRGLQPYTEEYREYFFGREDEAETIGANLVTNPLTIVYGTSGVGKTSVLLAGVVPHLRTVPDVTVVAFRDWQDEGFLTALKARIAEATFAKSQQRIDARAPLDDLLALANRATRGAFALILDQFEEYFFYHPGGALADEFDSQFAKTVNRHDIDGPMLVSIREDSLSTLDRFRGRIPNLFGNILRLEHLDRVAARRAIREPLKQFNTLRGATEGMMDIEDGLVEALVAIRRVRISQSGRGEVQTRAAADATPDEGRRIETPFLQMVLVRLWEVERAEPSSMLREETLNQLGGAEKIVQRHLVEVIEQCDATERAVCAQLFDRLVTPEGRKIAYTVPELERFAGPLRTSVKPVIAKLHEKRLLRSVAPDLGDDRSPGAGRPERYEIFHDVLAPAVLRWVAEQREAEGRAALERQAAEQRRRAEEQQRLAEASRRLAEKEGRAARLFKGLTAGLGACLIVIGVLVAFWRAEKRKAQTMAAATAEMERDNAATHARDSTHAEAERVARSLGEADGVARNAMLSAESDPQRSLLLALHALSRAKVTADTVTPATIDALLQAAAATPRMQLRLAGHRGSVRAVDVSPRGDYIATASEDSTVRIWDAESGLSMRVISSPGGMVIAVAFSPDGRRVAAAGTSGPVAVWDIFRGERLLVVDSNATCVAFSPDGQSLAIGNVDGTVRTWDSRTGSPGLEMREHSDAIEAVVFSADGLSLASASLDGTARIWDATTGERSRVLRGHTSALHGVAFSAATHRLVTIAGNTPRIVVWDTESGDSLFSLPRGGENALSGHTNTVGGVAFKPDGKVIATASFDRTVRLWDAASGAEIQAIRGHGFWVNAVAFFPDGRRLVTASADSTAAVWDVASPSGAQLLALAGDTQPVRAVAVSPDGRMIASIERGGTARLWDPASGDSMYAMEAAGFGADLRFGRKDQLAVAGPAVRLWNLASRTRERSFESDKSLLRLAFAHDGSRLAAGRADGTIVIWNPKTGDSVAALHGAGEPVWAIDFSNDNRTLLSAGRDNTVRLWDARSGDSLAAARLSNWIRAAAFSPTAPVLAAGGDEQTITLMDARSLKPLRTLSGHGDIVQDVAFSNDGNRLATASRDGSVRVWDMTSGRTIAVFPGHGGGATSVAFSPGGQWIVTGATDHYVRVFTLDPQQLLSLALARTVRPLQTVECDGFDILCPTAGDAVVMGRQLALEGRVDAAEAAFRRAAEVGLPLPFEPAREARRIAARGLVARGRFDLIAERLDKAKATFARALRLDPDAGARAVVLEQAAHLARAGDLARASAVYRMAPQTRQQRRQARQEGLLLAELGSAFFNAERLKDAERAWGEGVALGEHLTDYDRSSAYNNLAYLFSLTREHLDSAAILIARAIDIRGRPSQYLLDTYAWVLFQSGHCKDAVTPIKAARELADAGVDGEIDEHFVRIHCTCGSRDVADQALADWHEEKPDRARVVRAYAESCRQ